MNPFAVFTTLFLLSSLQVIACVRYVDLSHTYDESTIVWPGEESYNMTILYNGTVKEGYWFQKEKISTATHSGTHLDAPCHFSKGRWSVEQIPINHLITSAAFVDVTQKTSGNRDYQVSVNDLQEWESKNGKILHGAVLLINTGWAEYWPDKKKYLGTDTGNISLLHFPGISPDAAQWVATERNISGLGVDVPSVDYGKSTEYRTHQILAAKNVYFLENIGDMSELSPTGVMLHVMPMKLKGASGAPCRIVAVISDDDPGCNAAEGVGRSFPLIVAIMVLYCIKDM